MNKSTKQARKRGWCSSYDEKNDGNRIFEGSICDTAWDNKLSKKNSRKICGKRQAQQEQ